jgi:2-methylcitrate dehydratase PrpD
LPWSVPNADGSVIYEFAMDRRELTRRVASFKGTPQRPLDQAELKEKFMLLTRHLERSKMEATFERLQRIETEKALDWVNV